MNELIPIVGGLVAGVLVSACVQGVRGRPVAVVVVSAAVGLFACTISGELARSWVFLAVDVGEVFVSQTAVILALNRGSPPALGDRLAR